MFSLGFFISISAIVWSDCSGACKESWKDLCSDFNMLFETPPLDYKGIHLHAREGLGKIMVKSVRVKKA